MLMNDSMKIAAIIRDAGGEIVGRTRLQKVTYLLTVTGLEDRFSFAYKHYGPFSESVATAVSDGPSGRSRAAQHGAAPEQTRTALPPTAAACCSFWQFFGMGSRTRQRLK